MVEISRAHYGHSNIWLTGEFICDCGHEGSFSDFEEIDIEYIPVESESAIKCSKCGNVYKYKESFEIVQEVSNIEKVSEEKVEDFQEV